MNFFLFHSNDLWILIDLFRLFTFDVIIDIWNYSYHFVICLFSLHFSFHSSIFLPSSGWTEHFLVEVFGVLLLLFFLHHHSLHILLAVLLPCAQSVARVSEGFYFVCFVFFSIFVIHPQLSSSLHNSLEKGSHSMLLFSPSNQVH